MHPSERGTKPDNYNIDMIVQYFLIVQYATAYKIW
jgi:hypothetical protein